MKTVQREDAYVLWNLRWATMQQEWFKLEVLQSYVGEDDCPSLRAWLEGDKEASLKLLETDTRGWANQLSQKREQGLLMRRIRIVEKPYSLYTEWEFECYRHTNIPSGEQVFIVDKKDIPSVDLPSGDLMMFDNELVTICAYDDSGRVTAQTFYDQNDTITHFLQLKQMLLSLAQPLL